jgi:hypothetical protein
LKPNPLLVAAALVYGVVGFAFTFAPDEIVAALGLDGSPVAGWLGALAGAGLLGLAALDWMQRHTVLGGVLGRPVLVANLLFLFAAFFPTLRAWREVGGAPLLGATVALGALAAAFGIRLFRPAAMPPSPLGARRSAPVTGTDRAPTLPAAADHGTESEGD